MNWRPLWNRSRNLFHDLGKRWIRADCTTQAAAVSFYAALSLFPLVIILISGVGLFFEIFETGQNAEETVLNFFSEIFSPEMSASVAGVFEGVQNRSRLSGPLAAIVLIYLGSRVFTQINTAFEHIWDIHGQTRPMRISVRDWILTRLRSIALVGGFAALAMLVFFGNAVLYTAETVLDTWFPDTGSIWDLKTYLVSIAANTLVFGGIYWLLSKGPARVKLCLGVGLLVAMSWEIARVVVANLIIGEKYTPLGVVGSFLGIMLWIFCNNLALLSGAVVVRKLSGPKRPK